MRTAKNFQLCFQSLYKILGLEVVIFEDITVLNANTCTPDFNLIFDINTKDRKTKKYRQNLSSALSYANSKEYPFYIIRNEKNHFYINNIIKQFAFYKLEQNSTCMLCYHNINYTCFTHQIYTVQRVSTKSMMEDYCNIVSESFGVSLSDIKKIFYSEYFLQKNAQHILFLLYNTEKKPISTSMLYMPQDKTKGAGNYCWGTLPKYRNNGAMDILIKKMLNFLQKKGYSISVCHCYNTSINLAKKNGFISQGKIFYFSNIK